MNLHLPKTGIYYIVGILALALGGGCYLLCRPNTYVAQAVIKIIPMREVRNQLSWLDCGFLKYYLPDYLCGVALACGLHAIFNPKAKESLICTVVVVLLGALYEVLQWFGIISGTGDIVDVVLYALAGATVNVINYKRGNSK